MKKWFNTNVRHAGLTLVLGICFFGANAAYENNFLGWAVQAFETLSRDSQTQWLIVLCVASYFFLFNGLLNRAIRGRIWCCNGTVAWLVSLLGIGLVAYFLNVPTASKVTQLLTLLTGGMLGEAASWATGEARRGAGAPTLPTILVIWLLATSFGHTPFDPTFEYRGQIRWTGPWDNPNVFGLLMGTGMILATGLAGIKWQQNVSEKNSANGKFPLAARGSVAFCLLAMFFLGRGLFHSMSRGRGWLRAAVWYI